MPWPGGQRTTCKQSFLFAQYHVGPWELNSSLPTELFVFGSILVRQLPELAFVFSKNQRNNFLLQEGCPGLGSQQRPRLLTQSVQSLSHTLGQAEGQEGEVLLTKAVDLP